jgi:hypothetical protein
MMRAVLSLLMLVSATAWADDAQPVVDFAKDVKPILADRCYRPLTLNSAAIWAANSRILALWQSFLRLR